MKKLLYRYSMVTLGCLIMALALNCFYIQQHFLSGGISGIAMILYYLFQWPIGTVGFILNIPLFYIAYRYLSRDFLISTIFGTAAFSIFANLTVSLSYTTYVKDPLLSCVAGGLFYGIGAALVYRVDASAGGTDILGFLLHKHYNIGVNTTGFAINVALMIICAFLFGLEPALYSLVVFFICFKMTNFIMVGFDYTKSLFIISSKPHEIASAIIKEVGRGVTYIHGEGAYTHQGREIVFVVVKLTQVGKIKSIIEETDPLAFVIIHDANDVFGRGFTAPPTPLVPDEVEKQLYFYRD